jgi:hypothetical protein
MPEQEQRTPEEIKRDIEQTREDLGETAAELAQKADIKAQAKAKLQEAKESAVGKKDEIVDKARHASPDGASSAATHVSQQARKNPVPLAIIAAFVAGIVAGRILKR